MINYIYIQILYLYQIQYGHITNIVIYWIGIILFFFRGKILPISGIPCLAISFIIIINSKEKGGPNAIYCISRSDVSKSGTIRELVKSHGVNDDELELTWNPYEYPLLQIRTKLYLYNKNNRIDFTVNVITSF
mgnify:CR=1 FL=1